VSNTIAQITNSGSTTSPAVSSSASTTNNTELNSTDFLTLLTTELQNQDPLNPMDDTLSLAQLAQFTSVQSEQQLQTSFTNFQNNFSVLQSASLIGQTVSVTSGTTTSAGTSTATGTIQSIQVVNGTPSFTLSNNGQQVVDQNGAPITYTTADITAIGGMTSTNSSGG
jgi:flagellar basal-body rod modification protein FlgD